jgi:hypothetical protein
MQAAHISHAVGVVEDVKQRAVDDRLVAGLGGEVHRVGDLEAGVDALLGPVCPGLLDCVRCEVDSEHVISQPGQQDRVFACAATNVEHLAVNPACLLQLDDRRLRFADDPWRGSGLVGVVEPGDRWC